MEKNYRIHYLRMGEKTIFVDKNGEPVKFPSVNAVRRYLNKAREDEPNNPVTFMNRVTICEYNGDEYVKDYEKY